MIEINLIKTIVILVLFIFSAMPLHRAIKFFKGKTKFSKTLLITFISGIVISLISSYIQIYLGIITSIALIWIYKKAYKLKWFKAFLVWLLQIIFITISSIITGILLNLLLDISLFFN